MPTFRSNSESARSKHRQSRHGSSHSRQGRERHLSVRSQLRDQPDLPKIARAVIAHAMAQVRPRPRLSARRAAGREHPDA